MPLPSNNTYANGVGSVPADQLNTYVQWCGTYAQLRTFIGLSGMTVYLIGGTTPGDGGQGTFYWNSTSLGPDDGSNTIVPSGVTAGAWIRESIPNVAASFPSSGTVIASSGGTYIALGAFTLQLPQSSLQQKSFQVRAFAYGGAITVTLANASDILNGQSAGTGIIIQPGFSGTINTDAAGNWYATSAQALLGTGTIVSAATTDIGSIPQPVITVTGSASITSFGTSMQPGTTKNLIFTGTPTLTNSANLNLPAGASISVVAGALAFVWCTAVGTYYVFYQANTASTAVTSPAQGRLSLITGTPVMAADTSGASVVYYTPYLGIYFPYYDGNNTTMVSTGGELSLALDSNSGHTGYQQSGKNFDIFLTKNGSGTVVLCTSPAWTNDTTRASALAYKNGFLTNAALITLKFDTSASTLSIAANQALYVGTMRASADGQTSWVANPAAAAGGGNCLLYLWNMFNRVLVEAVSKDSTDSWAYTTLTWRSANGNNNNRVSFIRGLNEDALVAQYNAYGSYTNGASGRIAYSGVGIDSTSAFSGTSGAVESAVGGTPKTIIANYTGLPGLGYHFAQALEQAVALDAVTWLGDNGAPTSYQMSLAVRTRM